MNFNEETIGTMTIENNWWTTQYADSIIQYFFQKEETLPELLPHSPQLCMRRCLVDWLALIVEKFHICKSACHLAVYLLDHFMANHDIEESRLHLVAIGCLSIACKFDERDAKVPRLCELNAFLSNRYSVSDILHIEIMLLEFFDWNLCVPTPAHYIDYFTKRAISGNDLIMNKPISSLTHLKNNMKDFVNYFLDISIQDFNIVKLKPSVVAATCVASSRICLGLCPTWPSTLQKLTRLSLDQLFPYIEMMLQCLEADEMAARSSTKRKLQIEDENNATSHESPCKRVV